MEHLHGIVALRTNPIRVALASDQEAATRLREIDRQNLREHQAVELGTVVLPHQLIR